jgi:hypothetical protein
VSIVICTFLLWPVALVWAFTNNVEDERQGFSVKEKPRRPRFCVLCICLGLTHFRSSKTPAIDLTAKWIVSSKLVRVAPAFWVYCVVAQSCLSSPALRVAKYELSRPSPASSHWFRFKAE